MPVADDDFIAVTANRNFYHHKFRFLAAILWGEEGDERDFFIIFVCQPREREREKLNEPRVTDAS